MRKNALIFLLVASNSGGEGKTTIALVMEALWLLMHAEVELLDADIGNRALKVARENARTVGWTTKAILAPVIVDATMGKNAILDLGANTLASAEEVVDLIPVLEEHYTKAGYSTVVFMPLSTNKVGAGDSLKELAGNIRSFEKVYVKVNRDGSDNYGTEFKDAQVITLAHLEPGIMAAVRNHNQSIASFVSNPPPNHDTAAAHVAHWLNKFVQQEPVRHLLGGVPPILRDYSQPEPLRFNVKRAADATNIKLAQNARRSRMLDQLDFGNWSSATFRLVAELIDEGQL